MTMEKETFHFVSHTHWDREWYLTFDQFRFRLVKLIDNLLDLLEADENFKVFHLDGQTIVLEDYYDVRPSQVERLKKFIRDGRILVGPWYEQNDLFLTSAESTVRNLMEGIRVARQHGSEMKVGYLPDHFGLIGQMPQIFQGVGIDNAVFGRGYDIRLHGSPYLYWKAPDGSIVNGILMTHWYNNAQRLPEDENQLSNLFSMMKEREQSVSSIPHYLMMNGVDHLEAQETLTDVLQSLQKLYGDQYQFVHDTLPNYVELIKGRMDSNETSFPTVDGELRERDDYAILGGTLSSRIYLKQANLECHNLIEKWVEPLSAWTALSGLGNFDTEYIRYLWKLYMKNHPHDSICGCSQDAVHDHMMDRFAAVKEISGAMIQEKLQVISNQIDTADFERQDIQLTAFNTSQRTVNSVERSSIYFLADDDVHDFEITDCNGLPVPYRVISAPASSRIQVLSPINLPGVLNVTRFDIEWRPSIPPMGYSSYRVRPNRRGETIADKDQTKTCPVLENEYLRVVVNPDGTFDMTDKRTNQVYERLGQIEDQGDRGDLYVFTTVPGETSKIWDGPVEFLSNLSNVLYDECQYRFTWNLPVGLDNTYQCRQKQTIPCEFQITLRLDKQSEHLNVSVNVNNAVSDHRIRMLLPWRNEQSYILAGGQFDAVKRSWDEGRAFQRDANAQPFWKWLAATDGTDGVALYSKGLHEYETHDNPSAVGVTLLRCVENINVREEIALENDIQPKGQCIGQYSFELAIRPYRGNSPTQLYQEAESFGQGIRVHQSPVEDDRWMQGRAWVQDSNMTGTFSRPDPNKNKPTLPKSGSFVEIHGDVMLSAVKWADDDTGLILRMYNVESQDSVLRIACEGPFTTVCEANLLEETVSGEGIHLNSESLSIGPKKIVTYLLQ